MSCEAAHQNSYEGLHIFSYEALFPNCSHFLSLFLNSSYEALIYILLTSNLLVTLPLIRTELAKRNFVFQASKLWNALIGKLMNECRPNSNGIMIPGSANCSDLSAPISVIKKKLRDVLLLTQKLDSAHQLGWRQSDEWHIVNFFKH